MGKVILFFISTLTYGNNYFPLQVSSVNPKVSFIRFYVNFHNIKYLSKGHDFVFWVPPKKNRTCQATVLGKTNHDLLVKVKNFQTCMAQVGPTNGLRVKGSGTQYDKNISKAKELLKILALKRMAVNSKLRTVKKEVDIYLEKVGAVNSRYRLLRAKLMQEWRGQISDLNSDNVQNLKKFQQLKSDIEEVDHKIQKYELKGESIPQDRWALDRKIFKKK